MRMRSYEAADNQKKRVNRAIDWFMSKKVERDGEDDTSFTLDYKRLCVEAEAKYDTLSHSAHPHEIDTYAGASYLHGDGKIEVKPVTWLRNRGKLQDTHEISEQNREKYIIQEDGS